MLDWLYPQTVEIHASKINGQIKVTKSRGKYSVWVGGFEQSGSAYVEKLWKDALDVIARNEMTKQSPKNILILGLGCGTVVPLIQKRWPHAKIIGVEIDPTMVSLGKKYFLLDSYPNLTILTTDANRFLATHNKKHFDLVIIDTYIGGQQQLSNLQLTGPTIVNQLDPNKKTNRLLFCNF